MANIKVVVDYELVDGAPITFNAPCDASEITGLVVYHPVNGVQTPTTFALKDAHGNNLGDIDELFTSGAYVKVLLDTINNRAYVQNADTNAYLEGRLGKLDRVSGAIEYNGEIFDFVLGDPFFYLTKSVNTQVYLGKDCIGHVNLSSQKFYDRETGELLSSFEVDVDSGNGSKYQSGCEDDDLFMVNTSGGHHYAWIFNYKTGKYKHFSASYDGYMTSNYYGGRRGDSIYVYHQNDGNGYYVCEHNVNTMEQIATRSVKYQGTSYGGTWIADRGYLRRIARNNSNSKQLIFETLDLGTGGDTIAIVYTDTVSDHSYISGVSDLWIDVDNNEIYFTFYFYLSSTSSAGDYMFAKYNYNTNKFTVIRNYGTDPYPTIYCGHIDDNIALLKYSDGYMCAVDINTGDILRVSTSVLNDYQKSCVGGCMSSDYAYLGSYYKYRHKGKYVPFNNNRFIDVDTFEIMYAKYQYGTAELATAYFLRFRDEFIVSAVSSHSMDTSMKYYGIYDGKTLPESRNSGRVARRDS